MTNTCSTCSRFHKIVAGIGSCPVAKKLRAVGMEMRFGTDICRFPSHYSSTGFEYETDREMKFKENA